MSEIEARHYIGQRGGRARGARVGARDARGDGRPEVLRPARHVAARDAAARRVRRVRLRRGARLRRLVDPRLAGDLGERHAPDAGRVDARSSIRSPRCRRSRSSARSPTRSRASRTRRTRAASRGGRGVPALDRHRRHRVLRPRVRVLRLRRGLVRARPEPRRTTRSTRPRATGTPASPGLGYTIREKEGYFPPAPHDTLHDLRTQMVLTLERLGIPCEFHHHEVASGGPVRDRPALRDADADGRPGDDLQVRRQERRARGRQDGDVHAEADLRRQRLGHAHPPVALEGGHAADGRQVRVRRALAARARLRRRPARARAGAARVLRADDELVPPARARLRGAGQPRLLAAQPLARASASRCTRESPKAKRDRVPLPRPGREPVPRVLGDADGGPRRDRARPRPGRARATTTSSRRRTTTCRRCRARSPRRSTRSRPTTSSCSRAASSART